MMTRRAWLISILGLAAIAGAAGFAATSGNSSPSITAAPHWGLYSSATWNAVATKFERRGYLRESVHVATGTKLMRNGHSFALLGARSASGRTCFAVARGAALGPTICETP